MSMSEIERAGTKEIENHQNELLRKTLPYVYENSAYYRALFSAASIAPGSIRALSDLHRIPTTHKKDLQKAGKSMWCVPPTAIRDYSNTSGTEGSPLTVPMTENDLDRLALNEMLSFQCADGGQGEIYHLTTTIDRRFMAGLAYALGARKLGAAMVRVGPGLPQLHWDTIAEVGSTTLIAVPSFLLKMIEWAEVNGVDFKNTSVKKAICIGEPIRDADLQLNVLAKRIVSKWPIQLYGTYASTEMATAFTECGAGLGGHLQPELIIAEILDADGNTLPSGTPGELTITTLGIEAMPLVRFRTGDICAMYTDVCSCGRNTPRLGPILGRRHQMIKCKGTTCYPQALCEVLDGIPGVEYYQILIAHDVYLNDQVTVYYAAAAEIKEEILEDQFKSKVRFTPELVRLSIKDMQVKIYLEDHRKPVKIVDRRDNLKLG